MEKNEYANIFENEDSHFYYQSTHKIILSLAKPYLKGGVVILDAGCGTGGLTKKLAKYGRVKAVDIHPLAVKLARKRGITATKAPIESLPFKKNYFDIIFCIDVLYHKDVEPEKALKEFFRVLKPKGVVIIRVPAVAWLKTSHDKVVYTRERYSKEKLIRELSKAGLRIVRASYINFTLVPFILTGQTLEKILRPKPASKIRKIPAILNVLLGKMLTFEYFLSKFVRMPLGNGLIAVAQRP